VGHKVRRFTWGSVLGGSVIVCLIAITVWRWQMLSNVPSPTVVRPSTEQEWPPVIDDAPRPNGYYAYVRFDRDSGPFLDRDLPVVYLNRATHQKACFSGRVDGQLRHIIVATDFGRVTTNDPESDAGWAASGCSDALITGSQILTTREYWQTRLDLLPDTPPNAAQRQTIAQKIKALRPWWRLWLTGH
jgi:hypothetical protein